MAQFATFTLVTLLALIHATMSITVQEFFPDVKSNLTNVKWAHRTNSQADLKAALSSNETMMIEADVIMGRLRPANASAPLIPVMGHPPSNDSDLTLQDFITQVMSDKKKGMKLDFKSIEAFENGANILKTQGNLTVPVWLNADILKGPVNAGNDPLPVDAKRFLAGAAMLPQSLLSIGWTTRLEETSGNVTGKYTTEQITEMVKLVKDMKSKQSVTYPVRACFAVNDVDTLKSLLTNTSDNNPTLTVWSSEGDKVDVQKLDQLIKSVGVDKVYVDVPKSLWQQLNLANSAITAKSSFAVLFTSMLVALAAVKIL